MLRTDRLYYGHSTVNIFLRPFCYSPFTYVATCVLDFDKKEHKSTKGPVEYDSVKLIRFAPDCISLIACLTTQNKLAVFKVEKKKGDDTKSGYRIVYMENVNFAQKHVHDMRHIGIAGNGIIFYIKISSTPV